MWTCEKCGEVLDERFDKCWKCAPPLEPKPVRPTARVRCKILESRFNSWRSLCDDAAEFATRVGRERLINISHSSDQHNGVITIWYWSESPF